MLAQLPPHVMTDFVELKYEDRPCETSLQYPKAGQQSRKAAEAQLKVEHAVSLHHHDHQDHIGLPCSSMAEDFQNLYHIMIKIPPTTWLLVFVGLATACARYGTATPFRKWYLSHYCDRLQ
nr:hypothetical protein CFP56_00183 [Quercus suber]